MFGDVLRQKVHLLQNASEKKSGNNAFWVMLRDIAVEDIRRCYPERVDSVNAVPIYYSILKENEKYIPQAFVETMQSNNQEKYRVKNRNLWTSNAFHPDGLANQPGIHTERKLNEERKGDRIIYQGEPYDS